METAKTNLEAQRPQHWALPIYVFKRKELGIVSDEAIILMGISKMC
jgi:hypothetical protein